MAAVRLDTYDLRILREIQRDGRITKLALADRVGLSATPCWTRLRRLEDEGVIAGYHGTVALRSIAPFAIVFVEVSLGAHRRGDFDRFERAVKDIPEILACWAVGGGIDYLMKIVARDIDAYQRLIDSLLAGDLGIDRYFTYISMKTVKDENVVPIEALLA